MMMHQRFINRLFLFCSILVMPGLSGCSNGDNSSPDFDRTALLENMADNLIKPAYADLLAQVNALQTATTNFTQTPSTTTLASAQQAWEDAYVAWQYVNAYNIGPGGAEGLQKTMVEEVGIFPVNETKLETAASSGTYNLTDSNRDARGFLAIEYFLFDLQDDQTAIITKFTATNRKKFLNDLVSNVKSRIEIVAAKWNGSYREEFIVNNGTDVGSSVSQLYNEFLRSYETIKNFKIGLPLGIQPGQTKTEPTKVEAYYSGKSVKMFKTHIVAIENIWYGRKKNGEDGVGFEEYLQKVTGGEALITSTKAQMESIKTAMAAVPETPRFSQQLQGNTDGINTLHTELQKNTRYFKSDMSSLLGIAITFSSGDGD